MSDKRAKLLKAMAAIFEVPSVDEAFVLEPWDSLNVLQAVVAIDDAYGKIVNGRDLVDAKTVADVLKVAEA